MLGSKFTKFFSYLKQQIGFSSNFASLFSVIKHNSSVPSLYKREQLKSEVLHFDGLLLPKSYKVLSKFQKSTKSYLSWHWRVMQNLKKNWLVVSDMTWGICWSFIQPLKSWRFNFDGLFLSKVYKVWAKKNEQKETDLVVLKMAWGIGRNFIRALKSLKNCT